MVPAAENGSPIWYSGGKLAADLTWPMLTQRWHPARQASGIRLAGTRPTDADRAALFDHAAQAAASATAHIRAYGVTNPATAADAARAASDIVHVAAAVLGSRSLRQTADFYDHAAREPHGRIPASALAGDQLRHAARLMAACARLSGARTSTAAILILQLASLAEAIAELRQAQQRRPGQSRPHRCSATPHSSPGNSSPAANPSSHSHSR